MLEIANAELGNIFTLSFNDDQDIPSKALNISRVYVLADNIGIIGPRSSIASMSLANLTIPYISFGATSPSLSDKFTYPQFFRTIPSDATQVDAITDLLYLFGLNSTGILASNDFYAVGATEKTISLGQSKGINLRFKETFEMGNSTSIRQGLHSLRHVSTILVWSFSETDMITILEEAQANDVRSGKLFVFAETFNNINSSVIYTDPLFDGIVFVRYAQPTWEKSQFLTHNWNLRTDSEMKYYRFAYDALLAFRAAIGLGGDLKSALFKVDFIGTTGRVRFDANGDRMDTSYEFVNIFQGKLINIAKWSNTNGMELLHSDIAISTEVNVKAVTSTSPLLSNRWKTPVIPPHQIYDPSLSIDEENDKIYLFGGTNLKNFYSELYEYDIKISQWRVLIAQSDSPTGRYGSMSFILDKKLIIYGGFDNQAYFDEVWEYSIPDNRWKLLKVSNNPGARFNMGYAQYGRLVYLFGGEDATRIQGDLWIYDHDNLKFTLLSREQIPPRISPCVEKTEDLFIIHGGKSTKEDLADLWVYNIKNATWNEIEQLGTVPLARYGHSCWNYDPLTLILGMGWTDNSDLNPDLVNYNDFFVGEWNVNSSITWNLITTPETHKARYSQRHVKYQNDVIWIGGWGDFIFNSMWKMSKIDNEYLKKNQIDTTDPYSIYQFSMVHQDIEPAPFLALHSSVVVGDSLLMYGGIDDKSDISNKLWLYNVTTRLWSLRQTNTISPAGSKHHCAVGIGTRMILYGGLNTNYLEDMWEYSVALNSWTKIIPESTSPSARAGHTCFVDPSGNKMYVYGGRGINNFFNELWSFDLLNSIWKLEQTFSVNIDSLFGLQAAKVSTDLVLLYGGQDINGIGSNKIFLLNLNGFQGPYELGSFVTLPIVPMINTQMVSASENSVLIFGGSDASEVLYSIILQVNVIKSVSNITYNVKILENYDITPRDSHTISYYGDELYIFGGIGGLNKGTFKHESNVLNDMTIYKFGPICQDPSVCWSCGPSTFINSRQCTQCPPGSWSNTFTSVCTPCPSGFYNPSTGASDFRLCQPCPSGSYQPFSGSASCFECPVNMTCPIGSTQPSLQEIKTIGDPQQIQPLPLQTDIVADRLSALTQVVGILIGITCAILLFIMICCCSKAMLKILDLCETDHPPRPFKRPNGRLISAFKIQTHWIGGIFTVLFPVVVFGIMIILIAQPIMDPYLEIRSLIPNFSINRKVLGDLVAQVKVLKYSGSCTSLGTNCSSLIHMEKFGIQSESDSLRCYKSKSGNFTDCLIVYTCRQCQVEKSVSSVQFTSQEQNSYGSGYLWNVSSTAAYPVYSSSGSQKSNISSEIYSPGTTIFRGVKSKTKVSLATFETLYNIENGDTLTGYHFDFRDTTLGDQVNSLNFSFQNGIAFQYNFEKSLVSLEVSTQTKKQPVTIVSEILGTVAGVIGIFITIMLYMEAVKGIWDFCWYFVYKRERTRGKYSELNSIGKLWQKTGRKGYYVSSDDEDDDRDEELRHILGREVKKKKKIK